MRDGASAVAALRERRPKALPGRTPRPCFRPICAPARCFDPAGRIDGGRPDLRMASAHIGCIEPAGQYTRGSPAKRCLAIARADQSAIAPVPPYWPGLMGVDRDGRRQAAQGPAGRRDSEHAPSPGLPGTPE